LEVSLLAKNLSGMRIIVCGKGGCGKSTFVTLMAMVLRDKGYNVHVLDGDATNIGLYQMLGFEKDPEPLINYFGGKTFKGEEGKVTCPVDDPTPLDKDKMDLKRIPPEYFAVKNNITLFTVGKIKDTYEGCHGPESKVTRDFVLPGEHVTLIDIEAGIEHFGRGVAVNSDAVITVVDPTYTSFQIAENVQKMVTEMKVDTNKLAEKMVEKLGSDIQTAKEATKNLRIKFAWAVINKISSPKMEAIMKEKLKERGIKPTSSIHYDPEVSTSILEGIPLEEGEAKEDVEDVVNRLEDIVTRQSANIS
jgi:CO dehydrogenase maturation factor